MYRIRLSLITMLSVLFVLNSNALAQSEATEQGSMIVSGKFSIINERGDLYVGYTYDEDDRSMTTITAAPNVIYFIAPKVGIGTQLLYEGTFRGKESYSSWGIGPSLGYFFDSGASAIPYISGGVNYIGYKDTDAHMIRFNVGLGLLFRFDHLGLFMEAGYSHDEYKYEFYYMGYNYNDETISGTTIGISIGLAGFMY